MSTAVVVDASVWVANLVSRDVFHKQSQEWLIRQHSQGIDLVAPVFLLTEIAGVISRQTGELQLAHRTVNTLMKLPGLVLVRMNDTLVKKATDLAADLGLRGADSYYVAVAAYLNLPLATLDKDQSLRASSILPGLINIVDGHD